MGIPAKRILEVSLKSPNEATRSILQNPCIVRSLDNMVSSKPDYSHRSLRYTHRCKRKRKREKKTKVRAKLQPK